MNQYTIIPAILNGGKEYSAHRDALLTLWQQNLEFCFAQRFPWLYEISPRNRASTWLAVTKGTSATVACGSVLAKDFIYKDSPFRAGIAVDLAVNRQHRVFGPVYQLVKTIVESNIADGKLDFIFAYPNKKAELVFRHAGYKDIGSSDIWVHLVRADRIIGQKIKNLFLQHIVSRVLNLCLALTDTILMHIHSDTSAYIEKLKPDPSFDVLWNTEKNSDVIMAVKDAATLEWRYAENSSKDYRFFCRYSGDSITLLGFVVFSIESGVCKVYDVFSKAPSADHKKLLAHFIRHIRQAGAQSIVLVYFGNPAFETILRSLIFVRRASTRSCLVTVCRPLNTLKNTAVLSSSRWHLFDGDLDI